MFCLSCDRFNPKTSNFEVFQLRGTHYEQNKCIQTRQTSQNPQRPELRLRLYQRQENYAGQEWFARSRYRLPATASPVLTDPTFSSPTPQQVLVDDLCLAYLRYAEEHDPGHFGSIKTAVEILVKHYAGQPVDVLDTRHFLFIQDKFVEHGVSRQYCNALMGYIRAMLKWGIIVQSSGQSLRRTSTCPMRSKSPTGLRISCGTLRSRTLHCKPRVSM